MNFLEAWEKANIGDKVVKECWSKDCDYHVIKEIVDEVSALSILYRYPGDINYKSTPLMFNMLADNDWIVVPKASEMKYTKYLAGDIIKVVLTTRMYKTVNWVFLISKINGDDTKLIVLHSGSGHVGNRYSDTTLPYEFTVEDLKKVFGTEDILSIEKLSSFTVHVDNH